MRITIEASDISEFERIVDLLKSFKIQNVVVSNSGTLSEEPRLTKGDQNIDPSELFGMWKESPRSLDEIRNDSW